MHVQQSSFEQILIFVSMKTNSWWSSSSFVSIKWFAEEILRKPIDKRERGKGKEYVLHLIVCVMTK